jgi:hypothetical protein
MPSTGFQLADRRVLVGSLVAVGALAAVPNSAAPAWLQADNNIMRTKTVSKCFIVFPAP